MFTYNPADLGGIAVEGMNFLVFISVGIILLAQSHRRKLPVSRSFVRFCFLLAGSQLLDLLSRASLFSLPVPEQVLYVLKYLLSYGARFFFLAILFREIGSKREPAPVWKWFMFALMTFLFLVRTSSLLFPDGSKGLTLAGKLFLLLMELFLAAESVLVIFHMSSLNPLVFCAVCVDILGELAINLFIRDEDLQFALLATAGAFFAVLIYGIQMQQIALLEIRSREAAIAKISDEKERVEEKNKQMQSTLDKYVGHDVTEFLMSEQILHGQTRPVTILFADIEGFTTLCEQHDSKEVASILNLFLDSMATAILRNDGILDKFIGDCTMGLWNAAQDQPDGVCQACQAAIDIRDSVEVVNQIIWSEYHLRLKVNTGINYGQAIAGNFGSSARTSFTVVGDSVNVAARIQDRATHGEIFVTESVMEKAKERFDFREREAMILKGKSLHTEVFELIGRKN